MKRALLALVIAPLLVGCTSSCDGEFAGDGMVKGVFNVGKVELPDTRWVEMIQLSGPKQERCGPGDYGAIVGVFREPGGTSWLPGRWRVIPPRVQGMTAEPVVIVVEEGEVTTFELDYRPV